MEQIKLNTVAYCYNQALNMPTAKPTWEFSE